MNSLVYFSEIYFITLAITSIYIKIQYQQWPWKISLEFDAFITIFITSFTVYQILILVTINIFKANNIDGYQSFKTLCQRLLLWKNYNNEEEYKDLLTLYNEFNGNKNHRVIPKNVEHNLDNLIKIDFKNPELIKFLELSIIDMDHYIETDGFTWNSSILLNWLK